MSIDFSNHIFEFHDYHVKHWKYDVFRSYIGVFVSKHMNCLLFPSSPKPYHC